MSESLDRYCEIYSLSGSSSGDYGETTKDFVLKCHVYAAIIGSEISEKGDSHKETITYRIFERPDIERTDKIVDKDNLEEYEIVGIKRVDGFTVDLICTRIDE